MEIEAIVIRLIYEDAYLKDVKLTTKIEDLGFDSIDEISLLMKIEEYFNISLDETEFYDGIETVQDLCDKIKTILE